MRQSVPRHGRVDFLTPLINSARHVLRLRESLLTQHLNDLHAAPAVMTVDNDPFVTMILQLFPAITKLTHRDQLAADDLGRGIFVMFANIQEQKSVSLLLHLTNRGDINFDWTIVHIHDSLCLKSAVRDRQFEDS